MKRFQITVNGVAYDVMVEEVAAGAPAPVATPAPAAAPAPTPVATPAPAAAPAPANAETVKSPMPGTIVSVPVAAGDKVTKGQVLMVMEAMKMENEIMAPADGTVSAVMVKKGDTVETGTPLVAIG